LRGICVLRDFESKTQSIFVRYILYSTLCFISSKFFEKNETGGAGLWTMGGVYEGHSKKAYELILKNRLNPSAFDVVPWYYPAGI